MRFGQWRVFPGRLEAQSIVCHLRAAVRQVLLSFRVRRRKLTQPLYCKR